jgi:hypothetical protein
MLPNTTTLLAHSAINLLRSANQAMLDEAIMTLQNRSLSASGVMRHVEQNASFSEVLEKLAKEWSPETQQAFARAFNMDPNKTEIMDLIVAIAVLNEDDLEAELRSENTSEATIGDLLENRRITWQYPPPGTPLDPPYLVLVAVEHVDTARADEEIQSILGELVDYKGFKIPRRTAVPPLVLRPEILTRIPEILRAAPAIQPPPVAIRPAVPFSALATAVAAQPAQAAAGPAVQPAQAAATPTAPASQAAALAGIQKSLAAASRLTRGL